MTNLLKLLFLSLYLLGGWYFFLLFLFIFKLDAELLDFSLISIFVISKIRLQIWLSRGVVLPWLCWQLLILWAMSLLQSLASTVTSPNRLALPYYLGLREVRFILELYRIASFLFAWSLVL